MLHCAKVEQNIEEKSNYKIIGCQYGNRNVCTIVNM